ncbi:hypothetical protein [Pedobacter sp. BMA]|uniref:hypothetical protein n=1 Tax=Pedobacter sp. BMA TaxID=1663685 RepID=UPI00064B6F58|nr:hypothetical protein [Pedobacter sp. BMA]KLT67547.1 hypothetical protein AB669_02305 [Pedobacter sp. BMA]
MAIFYGKNIKGSLAGMVFSQVGDITVVRSKPEEVKQTAATKRAAAIFGKYISPFARVVRTALTPIHNRWYDLKMANRMNSQISTILYQHRQADGTFLFSNQSFDRLNGFNFNAGSLLEDSLLKFPAITWGDQKFSIMVPQYLIKDIRYPLGFSHSQLNIRVDYFNLEKGTHSFSDLSSYDFIRYVDGPTGENFEFDFPARCLVIISASVLFVGNHSSSSVIFNSKAFHPAGIIGARYHHAPGKKGSDKWGRYSLKLPLTSA